MKKVTAFLCGILSVVIMIIAPFFRGGHKEQTVENGAILSVWQIDSFSGGYGSRTTFLRKVLLGFTKNNPSVSVLVAEHTPSSAQALIDKGVLPNVISYGPCSLELQGHALKLSKKGFLGGEVNGDIYALPFLRGGYFVIEKGGGASEVIIPQKEYSSNEVACLFSGITASEYKLMESEEAFLLFLRSDKATMIGCQREIVRLTARNEDFTYKVIEGYSDLYQYLSITKEDNFDQSKKLVDYLISSAVQSKLQDIKMFSVSEENRYYNDGCFSDFEKAKITNTLSAFSTKSHLKALKESAVKALNEKGDKGDILKYLKQL